MYKCKLHLKDKRTVNPHSVYHGVLGSNPGGDRLK
jgi:hypothetical protein